MDFGNFIIACRCNLPIYVGLESLESETFTGDLDAATQPVDLVCEEYWAESDWIKSDFQFRPFKLRPYVWRSGGVGGENA